MSDMLRIFNKYRVDLGIEDAETEVDLGWLVITPWDKFNSKSIMQQRDILARASVCIHHFPITVPPMTMREEDLQTIGNIHVKRDMQTIGPYLRQAASESKSHLGIHLKRSLLEFKVQNELGDEGEVLNTIDLPRNNAHPQPFIINQFATHEVALNHTEFAFSAIEHTDARQGLQWYLLGMKSVDSHGHVDFGGADTYVEPQSGLKAWVVMDRGYEPHAYVQLLRRWQEDEIKIGLNEDKDKGTEEERERRRQDKYPLKCAFLMLEPGTLLMMRGCTEHYVLTVETSIMTGGQFIPAARMKASVVGLIHTMLLDYVVTNITHLNFWALYARIFIFWFHNVKQDEGLNGVINIHIPDYRQPEGLSNIVALGNLMLFGTAILLPDEKAEVFVEIETAKDSGNQNANFVVTMGDAPDWAELLSEANRRAENMDGELDASFFGPLPSHQENETSETLRDVTSPRDAHLSPGDDPHL
ncbi:hypothetical protein BDZ89DRAFT_1045191 [Hymenopellis radicata]|nr:hypothetical protein BDZ89DRAFT_1045191 [Hymenopellis radicata]